jgi:diacylglycerol kinase family enzyme
MSTAVVINLKARRGSAALEETVRRFLPDARVALTRNLEEAKRFFTELRLQPVPELIVSGGGDGTAVSLLNEWHNAGAKIPTLGLVPLGTGNGWARATSSPSFVRAMERLSRHGTKPLPTRTFGLVEVEGQLSPWAGTGWDAEIVSDYQRMMRRVPEPMVGALGGFPGYMVSLFGTTVPRMAFRSRTSVRLINLGSPAMVIDASGKPVPVPGGDPGAVLYEGHVSVCGSGTTSDLGLGFRAFPFAHAMAGRMATRIYSEGTIRASLRVRQLWQGAHPLPNDHHWMLDACRMEFDRPVTFEIGGDVLGERTSVDFRLAEAQATLLDWSKLAA